MDLAAMKIYFDSKNDLLYLRFDAEKQAVTNMRLNEDIVVDFGENEKIVGMEILNASRLVNLKELLPVISEVV
ncbi:MAG: DUF2283 domain-containing protein [Chitinophagales bacterium]|nr:DUF2283 domain-containing protein [Chitinophagales bacterium]MDW8394070.1 DUF2283 domain-containing protein [Chitinophagales bacterium]